MKSLILKVLFSIVISIPTPFAEIYERVYYLQETLELSLCIDQDIALDESCKQRSQFFVKSNDIPGLGSLLYVTVQEAVIPLDGRLDYLHLVSHESSFDIHVLIQIFNDDFSLPGNAFFPIQLSHSKEFYLDLDVLIDEGVVDVYID